MARGFKLGKSIAATTEPSRSSSIPPGELRASDVLEALATALNSRTPLVRPGLAFDCRTVRGILELSNVDIPIPISFTNCVFDSAVVISNCHTLDLSFSGSSVPSMDLSSTVIDGNLVANEGFVCAGEFALRDARVTGVVTLESAKLINPGGKALNCSGATFDSIVLLRNGFHAKGEVRFLRATIAGNLQCRGAIFENPGGIALDLSGSVIRAGLYLNGLAKAPNSRSGMIGHLNLQSTQTRVLRDDGTAWPDRDHIMLDGFTYEHFDNCPTSAEFRYRWLCKQPPSQLKGRGFRAQPWQQVYSVLKRMGHVQDCVKIQTWKYDKMVWSGAFGFWGGVWNGLLGVTSGYGHRPWKAVRMCLLFIAAGAVVYHAGHRAGHLYPAKEEIVLTMAKDKPCPPDGYPIFDPFVYSLDTFLPFVDLNQEAYWLPISDAEFRCDVRRQRDTDPTSRILGLLDAGNIGLHGSGGGDGKNLLQTFFWVYKLSGVFLVALAGLAFSGLLKRE